MYRGHPNVVPVASKYLAHKEYIQDRMEHKQNIKNAQGLIDLSSPPERAHCYQRIKQKKIKEYELAIIERENARLRTKMLQNGAFVKTHNSYETHSLNNEKRHRDDEQHKTEIARLQKQINHARTNYPSRKYQNDYTKQQDLLQRISKFPPNNK
ncbi:unnamed protein product [Rotaria magnacalcarata]|uniref:Uncharacterized protein n=3 Tax=Rotaria magnacalcarata TaxID=392030 RepID=A0A815DTL8_9BILA|nr:unnamed protein product [Rotaria magnacalcarata]CAF1601892.1 unnamed protein product [Rotaria magnacalcarata]CAF2093508.1 unnamed protein product [Rotaria magnacalcarata]CAF2154329.1 unnamed protein product [Rotaria magnacalcarata]CAF2263053.1 unnamed protein product [Rotaria magnacalcarata]